ncbi:MAG TPA: hypothetical protein VME18_02210 [Acidobacteriaceae bacterium]|nr:hypothetical protein [Acidobacteriaceae bacterium]
MSADLILAALRESMPELALLLVVLVFAFLLMREWRRMRGNLSSEIETGVRAEIGGFTVDILRRVDDARQQLSSLARMLTAVNDERNRFEAQLTSAKQEAEKLLSQIRAVSGEVARFAPARSDLEWVATETLLGQAAKAVDWPEAAGYLARMDHENATSKDLEHAGDICRDRASFVKALAFYDEAAKKDPENLSARVESLALSAKMHPGDRNKLLTELQSLAVQNVGDPADGVKVLTRFFGALKDLGRYREMADFCEAQLRLPAARAVEAALHRNLAVCYEEMGRHDDALAQCSAALKVVSDDSGTLALYGRLLFCAREYDDAYRVAIRGIQTDPASAAAYMFLADVQEKRVGRSAAREILKTALKWANSRDQVTIEDRLARLAALDELSDVLPTTRPQIIQA